ncbi:hypothetical protein Q5752_004431 [Cryptotrichosporon argae]
MDIAYMLVASKCEAQMAAYQNCVMKHQNGDWSSLCAKEGQFLADCAAERTPELAALKQTCRAEISAHQSCLRAYGALPAADVQQRCAGLMRALWTCGERARADMEVAGTGADGVAVPSGSA